MFQTIYQYQFFLILSKVLEKIVQVRLIKFLNKHNIICDKKYGFQENKSTTLTDLDLYSKIIKALDNADYACFFLDFAESFDTVSQKILVKKLENYGASAILNKWFILYLTNRYKVVKISPLSKEILITCGVPQGSILRPILFLIHINDIKDWTSIYLLMTPIFFLLVKQ